jgi:hypothetical protein
VISPGADSLRSNATSAPTSLTDRKATTSHGSDGAPGIAPTSLAVVCRPASTTGGDENAVVKLTPSHDRVPVTSLPCCTAVVLAEPASIRVPSARMCSPGSTAR